MKTRALNERLREESARRATTATGKVQINFIGTRSQYQPQEAAG